MEVSLPARRGTQGIRSAKVDKRLVDRRGGARATHVEGRDEIVVRFVNEAKRKAPGDGTRRPWAFVER